MPGNEQDKNLHQISLLTQAIITISLIATWYKFFYSSGISVVSEASFMMPQSYPFRMYFRVEFESAVVEMDFWQPKNQRLKVFPAADEMFIPELSGKDAYRDEIAYFADCVNDGKAFDRVPLDESINSLLLCLKSKESCEGKNQLEVSGVRS